jgi:hypothetical protein
MKRITYNGQPLITSTEVADAIVQYVTQVAGSSAAVAVDVPVLEPKNTVVAHTLLLSAATQLAVAHIDGVTGGDERERFPIPQLPPLGVQASPVGSSDIESTAPVIDEDPWELVVIPGSQ